MASLFLQTYPSWLVSFIFPGEEIDVDSCAPTHNHSTINPVVNTCSHMKLSTPPHPQSPSSPILPSSAPHPLECARSGSALPRVVVPSVSGNKKFVSIRTTRVPSTQSARVPLPLPFSKDSIANTIPLSSHGRRGVSLAEWAKLSERRKTYIVVDEPHASLDELFSNDRKRVLLQSHWPGYDTRTCYLDMALHVTEGERVFTRVNLLDMVCGALVDWVVKVTNDRHVECREKKWAIGLEQVTFKHIYVTSVVEVKGYVSKWVPVLEIDSQAFAARR